MKCNVGYGVDVWVTDKDLLTHKVKYGIRIPWKTEKGH